MEECISEKTSYERMYFTVSLLIEECIVQQDLCIAECNLQSQFCIDECILHSDFSIEECIFTTGVVYGLHFTLGARY